MKYPDRSIVYSRLYHIYQSIKQRCYYPKAISYKLYGAKGIVMCDGWKNDFMSFYNWAIANGYSDNLTIDRINSNGNYEPSNCRWVTPWICDTTLTYWDKITICIGFVLSLDLIRWGLKKEEE